MRSFQKRKNSPEILNVYIILYLRALTTSEYRSIHLVLLHPLRVLFWPKFAPKIISEKVKYKSPIGKPGKPAKNHDTDSSYKMFLHQT